MNRVDAALFVSVSLIWGASFLLIAEALEAFSPGVVTLGRVGFGALTLWVLRLIRCPEARIVPEDRRSVLVLAIVWVALPFTLFPIAQQWINSAVTGLLNGATPIMVSVVSVVLYTIAPTRRQIVGLAIGFVGIALISLGSGSHGASGARGVLLIVGATVCYGFAINLAAPLQARYGAIPLMSSMLGIATLFNVPFAIYDWGNSEWTADAIGPGLALFLLGSVGTGIAYWIMANLVGRIGSIRASLITYLIPVVSLVLGMVFRGDEIGALALVGLPLTIGGAALASRRGSGGA